MTEQTATRYVLTAKSSPALDTLVRLIKKTASATDSGNVLGVMVHNPLIRVVAGIVGEENDLATYYDDEHGHVFEDGALLHLAEAVARLAGLPVIGETTQP